MVNWFGGLSIYRLLRNQLLIISTLFGSVNKMNYHFIKKGEWKKYRKEILFIENKCFKKKDQTFISTFKEMIDDINPYTLIARDGKNPIGYFMCAPLEESGDDLKDWDKNFGKKNTLYLFSIGVIPEYRGKGVGSEMLEILFEHIPTNYSRITLHTKNRSFKRMCIRYGFRNIDTGLLEGKKMTYLGKWLR